ncbi:hypothetical protein OCU04_008195 [Sclerotinia nivalis]|uniref:2EXR domain-containing protein n=1 Tax=Sclerotinia nivalis TaxID=352851 RepID=A0A9X0AIN4_9HELO|nr:hypothetical protein OCU04_008195 [Sclerotinia nivalis]
MTGKVDLIKQSCVAQPGSPFDIPCHCALHRTQHDSKQSASAQNRISLPASQSQCSRIHHLTSRLDFSQISRLPCKFRLRRMKKSGNLASLIKAKIKPHYEIVTRNHELYFPKFAVLPIELRLQIWEEYLANATPRDIPVWRVKNPHIHSSTSRYINIYDHNSNRVQSFPLKNGLERHHDFKWVCPQPDILYINSEARQVGLKVYTQQSLNGTICSKKSWEIGSETGPATIYRHINGMDRIMPMYDFSNGHNNFWHEHEHQLEGRIALNAFLYDLDPNQPILPRETPFMPASDSFIARGRRENYDIEVPRALAAVVPSTGISPASRAIGHSHPFYIKEITIYYNTESLIGVKDFTWSTIDTNNLTSYPGSQAMLNMERAIKSTYQHWELQRYRHWVHYTNHMKPSTLSELLTALDTPETKKKLGNTVWLLLVMTRDNPLLREKYAARMAHKIAHPRRVWSQRLEEVWEVRVPVLPRIGFAVCGVAEKGLLGL